MCNSHTENKNEFWVTLIEKGIMKMYGSTLEPMNTNPSFEVFHLIGWIPEVVVINDIANKENLWTRLHQNVLDGNILVSIGTADVDDPIDPTATQKISASTSNLNRKLIVLDLIANHTYALIGIEDVQEGRFLKCKNPWGRLPPSLPCHPFDTASWTPELCRRLRYVPPSKEDNGVFWVTWEDVVQHFTYMCLAWNPALYPYQKTFHASWNLGDRSKDAFSKETITIEYCPQFVFSIPPHAEDFEVRVMLQKHTGKFEIGKNRIAFMLYNYDGYRIIYPINALREHKYSSREVFSDVFIFENSVILLKQSV